MLKDVFIEGGQHTFKIHIKKLSQLENFSKYISLKFTKVYNMNIQIDGWMGRQTSYYFNTKLTYSSSPLHFHWECEFMYVYYRTVVYKYIQLKKKHH